MKWNIFTIKIERIKKLINSNFISMPYTPLFITNLLNGNTEIIGNNEFVTRRLFILREPNFFESVQIYSK